MVQVQALVCTLVLRWLGRWWKWEEGSAMLRTYACTRTHTHAHTHTHTHTHTRTHTHTYTHTSHVACKSMLEALYQSSAQHALGHEKVPALTTFCLFKTRQCRGLHSPPIFYDHPFCSPHLQDTFLQSPLLQSSIKNELACEKVLIQGLDKAGRPILIVQVRGVCAGT